MHAFLTVKEVVTFSALMRLPSSMSYSEKMRRVDDTIAQLGLNKCKNTRVGNTTMRGISGGEKKRVNVGTELVKNPSVLFLDEPTSGLDAFTSLNLLTLLKQIAQNNGQTIVCTIHQPRAAIFNMFDSLMLLGQGETVYFGIEFSSTKTRLTRFLQVLLEEPCNTLPTPDFRAHNSKILPITFWT
jgi:ABC-type multidrug transport system ATPase subunit